MAAGIAFMDKTVIALTVERLALEVTGSPAPALFTMGQGAGQNAISGISRSGLTNTAIIRWTNLGVVQTSLIVRSETYNNTRRAMSRVREIQQRLLLTME